MINIRTGPAVTIALLVKNAGPRLTGTLSLIRHQELAADLEIVAIDSGSTDSTVNTLRACPGVRLIQIDSHAFQHGRTRNLAVSESRGDLVILLAQDAVPASLNWVQAFVDFMTEHPNVAGGFGYQRPHPGEDAIEAWEVQQHFDSFKKGPFIFSKASALESSEPSITQSRAHFFSNVNSCIRRSVWERVSFPEVEFGEDQAWAFQVQKAGMSTAFVEKAAVFHSHSYPPVTLLRRRYDEARFMRRQFGYTLVGSVGAAINTARSQARIFRSVLDSAAPKGGLRNASRAHARALATSAGWLLGVKLADTNGFLHRALSLTESYKRR